MTPASTTTIWFGETAREPGSITVTPVIAIVWPKSEKARDDNSVYIERVLSMSIKKSLPREVQRRKGDLGDADDPVCKETGHQLRKLRGEYKQPIAMA